jgi:hypothetical protein
MAIINVRPKNGGMLLCGTLLPVIDVPRPLICTLVAATEGAYAGGRPRNPDAHVLFVGTD